MPIGRFAFIAIAGIAIVLRLQALDRPLNLDEYRTVRYANQPIGAMLDSVRRDSYPPLSYLLLKQWLAGGRNDVWIRLLFVIFGVLSVLAVYAIGRAIADRSYALVSMLLVTLMPMQVWISQYVRGTGMSILWILLSSYFFVRILEARKICLADAAGYAVSAILAAYSFYFSFFIVLAQNLSLVPLLWRRGDVRRSWFLLQLIVIAAFLPWAGSFITQMKGSNVVMNLSFVGGAGLVFEGLPIGILLRSFAGLWGLDEAFFLNTPLSKTLPREALVVIAVAGTVLIAISVYRLAVYILDMAGDKRAWLGGKRSVEAYLLLCAVLPFIIMVGLNVKYKTPIMPRYFAPSSVFMALLIAKRLSGPSLKLRTAAWLLIPLAAFSMYRIHDFTKPSIDYKSAAYLVRDHIGDDECLLLVAGDDPYLFYCSPPKHYVLSRSYIAKYKSGGSFALKDLVDDGKLLESIAPYKSVWVYESGDKMWGLTGYVLGIMEKHGFAKVAEYPFVGLKVYRYEHGG